jgi:hypothetical protein
MLRGSNKVNAETFQVVIRVCESRDFSLASIARSRVELADIQSSSKQAEYLAPNHVWNQPLFFANYGFQLPGPDEFRPGNSASSQGTCNAKSPLASVNTSAAANAFSIVQIESQAATIAQIGPDRFRRTHLCDPQCDRRGQEMGYSFRHSAAGTVVE